MSYLTDILEDAAKLEGEALEDYLEHEICNLQGMIEVLSRARARHKNQLKVATFAIIDNNNARRQAAILTQDELQIAQERTGKIRAIKAVRERTGLGLADSKASVELALGTHNWRRLV